MQIPCRTPLLRRGAASLRAVRRNSSALHSRGLPPFCTRPRNQRTGARLGCAASCHRREAETAQIGTRQYAAPPPEVFVERLIGREAEHAHFVGTLVQAQRGRDDKSSRFAPHVIGVANSEEERAAVADVPWGSVAVRGHYRDGKERGDREPPARARRAWVLSATTDTPR